MANRISVEELERQIVEGAFENYNALASVSVTFPNDSKLVVNVCIARSPDVSKKENLRFYRFSVDGCEVDDQLYIFKFSFVQAIADYYARQHREYVEHDLNQRMKAIRARFLGDISGIINDIPDEEKNSDYRVLLKGSIQSFLES